VTAPATTDRRATYAFAAVAVLSLVVLFSPRAPSESTIPNLDKVVHAGLFLLLCATAWWRFAGHRAVLPLVLLYGALSEVIQSVGLATRDGDVRDFTADAAGALLGWVLARRISRAR
jgi:VanZ family protein